MITFLKASQVRASLKMKLSNFSWYNGSLIALNNNDYYIIVNVKAINNLVKKSVPIILDGVSIKLELDN